jgi:hypothetical protein
MSPLGGGRPMRGAACGLTMIHNGYMKVCAVEMFIDIRWAEYL